MGLDPEALSSQLEPKVLGPPWAKMLPESNRWTAKAAPQPEEEASFSEGAGNKCALQPSEYEALRGSPQTALPKGSV